MAENSELERHNLILDGPRPEDDPRVTVLADDVHMTYDVMADRRSRKGRRMIGGRKKMRFRAVRGVSLAAREGEFIGLVGRNGSGKSTLLRMLAGVEPPTKGAVVTSAKPQLLGVSAALMPDLSGEENIRLGLLALGLAPAEVMERRNRIADLSGLGDALRMPMRTYSSGMGARLRFAISVAADPDILMIDEALSTGDASFMERSKKAMERMIDTAGTVFLVSHAAQTIEELCTRAIWLDQGELIADGPAVDIARAYRWYAHNLAQNKVDKAAGLLNDARQTLEDRRKSIRSDARLLQRKSYAEATGQIQVVPEH
ncbi:ABC transporter ATP-binding protein [Gulosibacter sediminis]|uniref:ABC transporter ATP-binding protein n=1 Tax=Gulosibacter sediminis TaxID=1729695 RepID=UPI0024ACDE5A|nr:ABC transporter ATP-binding protein [Gulosibacter sediminis]